MVNIDAEEIEPGDLTILKKAGVRLSNPETEEEVCLNCEYDKPTFGHKVREWFDSDDDDDSSFFHSSPSVSIPSFGGSPSFGGFGGGLFSGGGAGRSF
jgi:hypothetical protein